MIEVTHLQKNFGRKKVLKDVSFTAEKGEITCLIGINGVGKTTILNTIMGLTPKSGGKIRIDEEKIGPKLYEKIAYIPDAITMIASMRISAAMEFMSDFYKNWNQQRADELLEFFKLEKDMKISALSKGNTAKMNLLLGLSLDVDYILMDEPFSGIDIFSREQITEVFTSHLIENRGVIVTTHDIHEIEHLIDEVVLLDEGEILRQFNAEEVRDKEGKSIVDIMREVYQ